MKIDKDKVLAIIISIGIALLTRLPRILGKSVSKEFIENNPILLILAYVGLIFILYIIIRSIFSFIYKNGFRKDNIKELIYWSSLISIIFLFGYSMFHFSFNNKFIFLLLFIGLLVVAYFLTKEIYNDCLKHIGFPLGLFMGCFTLLQISLFIEKKYSNKYYSEGKHAFQENNYSDAIENFNIYIRFHKETDSSYYYLGQSNLKISNFDEAFSNFKKIKSTNFNYRKEILTELLDYSIHYLKLRDGNNYGNIDNKYWEKIDNRYKDTLVVNINNEEFFADTIKGTISLKKMSYLTNKWSMFRNLSIKIASNKHHFRASEKNFYYYIKSLSLCFNQEKKPKEIILKYFGKITEDEKINNLIIKSLTQSYYLSDDLFRHSDNYSQEFKEFLKDFFMDRYYVKQRFPEYRTELDSLFDSYR